MSSEPSIDLLWNAFTGYQRTAVIKAAIELDVFSKIAAGTTSLAALARACEAAPRGLEPLLDHLVVDGFLVRRDDEYGLAPTAEAFLNRASPAYLGSAITFIASPALRDGFFRLTEAVRRGGTMMSEEGTLEPEHPIWVEFARAMAPLANLSGTLLANLLEIERAPAGRVLDVAAGHGMFGIALARVNPQLQITALDWANVLAVAETNARTHGVADRFHRLPGSAFEVPWGSGYAYVLLPNFLHHFDVPTCEQLLTKAHAALAPGGRVVLVEFIPNENRLGPADAVRFRTVMLASTPSGDAWRFSDYRGMLERTGFQAPTVHDLSPTPMRAVIAAR